MSPHDPKPTPRTIDVDVSAILVHPRLPEGVKAGQGPESALPSQIPSGISERDLPIGPFGWANISFVVGSCLIALFSTLFVSENAQHFRRRAHLSDDVIYAKPDIDSTTSRSLNLDPSQLVSNMRLERSPISALNRREFESNRGSLPSSLPPSRANSSSPFLPNLDRAANNGLGNNPSSARSNNVAQNAPSGETTTSKSATSSSTQKSNSVRSSSVRSRTTRMTRRSSRQTLAGQSRSLGSRQTLRRPLTSAPAKSADQTANNLKLGNQQFHRGLETHAAAARSQMPMHSMGQGSMAARIQGATMNPMRMESGGLAQGMGGVTGNGLGAIGHHGGHGRR